MKIVRLHAPQLSEIENALARQLATTYRAQIWADPVRLHQACGDFATDIPLSLCIEMVHDADAQTIVGLLREAMDRAVKMVAETRSIGESMDLDYVGGHSE